MPHANNRPFCVNFEVFMATFFNRPFCFRSVIFAGFCFTYRSICFGLIVYNPCCIEIRKNQICVYICVHNTPYYTFIQPSVNLLYLSFPQMQPGHFLWNLSTGVSRAGVKVSCALNFFRIAFCEFIFIFPETLIDNLYPSLFLCMQYNITSLTDMKIFVIMALFNGAIYHYRSACVETCNQVTYRPNQF